MDVIGSDFNETPNLAPGGRVEYYGSEYVVVVASQDLYYITKTPPLTPYAVSSLSGTWVSINDLFLSALDLVSELRATGDPWTEAAPDGTIIIRDPNEED